MTDLRLSEESEAALIGEKVQSLRLQGFFISYLGGRAFEACPFGASDAVIRRPAGQSMSAVS